MTYSIKRAVAQRMPSRCLLWLNGQPQLKHVLRRAYVQASKPGDLQEVELRKGPAKGCRLVLDMGTDEQRICDGTYEPWVHDVLPRVLHPGGVLWDVGAHVGYYCIVGSLLSTATHLAIEPGPSTDRLQRNLALNGITNVDLLSAAVGSQVGTARFDFNDNSIFNRISEGGDHEVNVLTLDSLLDDRDPPSVIMMDIEGGERRPGPRRDPRQRR